MACLRLDQGEQRSGSGRFCERRTAQGIRIDRLESATYSRDDGRKVALKAIRFADASGAYGAFAYYKMPQMLTESIPDQGSSLTSECCFIVATFWWTPYSRS